MKGTVSFEQITQAQDEWLTGWVTLLGLNKEDLHNIEKLNESYFGYDYVYNVNDEKVLLFFHVDSKEISIYRQVEYSNGVGKEYLLRFHADEVGCKDIKCEVLFTLSMNHYGLYRKYQKQVKECLAEARENGREITL